ncbi:hypothetical protein RIF29_29412 [Crotalaria pallida]|uniref:Uncharacterized protein n=1 Tax=Crotalaria pallida TaxID=3830 RepID=A0AAN9HTW6_CROPI
MLPFLKPSLRPLPFLSTAWTSAATLQPPSSLLSHVAALAPLNTYREAKRMAFMDVIVVVKGRDEDVRSSAEELRTKTNKMAQLYVDSFLLFLRK